MRALAPVVRILNPVNGQWVGCGFLVPARPGDAGLAVITCAHVVADALGQSDLMHAAAPPVAPVEVLFGVDGQRRDARILAAVERDGWRRSPAPGERVAGAIDIAVLRLDLPARPPGAEYPRFADRVQAGRGVIAHGPHLPSDFSAMARGHWVDGQIREQAQPDEIEFLAAADIETNIIVGGFSGGPLTLSDTGEIAGMVRAVLEGHHRRAYALPFAMLAEVWPPLRQQVRRSAGAIHAIFDLIDRKAQLSTLADATRLRRADEAPSPMVVTVAGPQDEDHAHLRRRARDEISRYRLREASGPIHISDLVVTLPEGLALPDRLADMAAQMQHQTRAAGPGVDHLREAFAKGSAGWIVHISVGADLSAEDADLLTAFLDLWRRIADGAVGEMVLKLSFLYAPGSDPGCAAARFHASLLADPQSRAINLPALASVAVSDIHEWQQTIARYDRLGDEALAEALAFEVEAVFENARPLPMRRLRMAIQRAGIDPEVLAAPARQKLGD